MWKPQLYARTSALPAIAAALALSSTGAIAQEAQPVTVNPPPVVTTEPATTTASPPAAPDTTATTSETTTETAAPAKAVSKASRTTTRTARTATVRPAALARTVSHTVAMRSTAPAAPVAAAAKPAAPAPTAPTSQSAVSPVVDMNAKPTPAPTTTAAKPTNNNEKLEIAGGGALALLLLGGGAYALSRRRRRADEEEWYEEEPTAQEPAETVAESAPRHDPIVHEEQPAIVAPSAFAWGNEPKRQDAEADDDRLPGETWIQRAYRGPTPNNPSVSLKARLKRAAFFDKRERDVAAGTAEPVDMDAGLPDAMVEEQERELA